MVPYYEQFINFINEQNPRNLINGNPNISEVKYDNFYLGFIQNKENRNFSSDLFFSLTTNDIRNVRYPFSETVTLTIPENIAKTGILGIDLSSWVSVKNKFEFNLSSSIFYTIIDAGSLKNRIAELQLPDESLKKEMFGYIIKFSTSIKFNSTTSAYFYFDYHSKDVNYMGCQFEYINSSINISKKFFDKKLLVSLGINNLFDDIIEHGSYKNHLGLTQNTTRLSSQYKRTYFIRLQYTFRKGGRGTKNINTR